MEGKSEAEKSVCFLGPLASFSHQATLSTFAEEEWTLKPAASIGDIFDVVQAGEADYGVVPFENSTNGCVLFTLDSFADRRGVYPDLAVCAEIYLDVHHYLLGHKPPPAPLPSSASASAPASGPASATAASTDGGSGSGSGSGTSTSTSGAGSPDPSPAASGTCTPTAAQPNPTVPRARPAARLAHVRRVYSHPQAFGQCAAFLGAYLRGVETLECGSTSRAAQLAAADGTGASAAIASALAGRVCGVDVLAAGIEDREDNTTRFFVIRRHPGPRRGGGVEEEEEEEGEEKEKEKKKKNKNNNNKDRQGTLGSKSLVSFTVPHAAPGALADVLECFRRAGLNLTSINSLPSQTHPFQYIFFVEFEGSRLEDPDGKVQGALDEVAKVAHSSRWLGSWERIRY